MRFLIVDDSALIREQIKQILKEYFETVEIEIAENGVEALEKHRSFKPAVIMLDYIIPEPDGLAILKILKKVDKQVQVILVTTLGGQKYIYNQCIEYGAAAITTKPITKEKIIRVINNILG
ncbi:MAG: cheY [Firmicutes bacterium]|nr:cheY [Bacillota bacterium]